LGNRRSISRTQESMSSYSEGVGDDGCASMGASGNAGPVFLHVAVLSPIKGLTGAWGLLWQGWGLFVGEDGLSVVACIHNHYQAHPQQYESHRSFIIGGNCFRFALQSLPVACGLLLNAHFPAHQKFCCFPTCSFHICAGRIYNCLTAHACRLITTHVPSQVHCACSSKTTWAPGPAAGPVWQKNTPPDGG
jgi:hypothetical protein